jgi:hypothetical protein
MAKYIVKSRFWDADRKTYVAPGTAWTPASDVQAARLVKAGCLAVAAAAPRGNTGPGRTSSPNAESQSPTVVEELAKLTKAQLLDIARARGIDIPPKATTNAAIIEVLLAALPAPPAPAGS